MRDGNSLVTFQVDRFVLYHHGVRNDRKGEGRGGSGGQGQQDASAVLDLNHAVRECRSGIRHDPQGSGRRRWGGARGVAHIVTRRQGLAKHQGVVAEG